MTSVTVAVLVGALFVASLTGTRWFVRHATKRHLFDVPNARSSHTAPVPRGGGLVFSVLTLAGLVAWSVVAPPGDAFPSMGFLACAAVVALGFADDRLSLPATSRLACQIAAGTALMFSLGAMPPLSMFGSSALESGPVFAVLCVIGLVWLINLYNFMDGIDALAAGEGLFVALAGAALCLLRGEVGVAVWLLVLAATLAGFIVWNLPPAKVFMGDAGSVFLGFFFGAAALFSHARGGPEIWVWLILLGTFCVDATVTLLRRIRFGEHPIEAHRTHAYQYLSRRIGSHGRVSAGVAVTNLLWLGPLALTATLRPDLGLILSIIACLPLTVIALGVGAGVPEQRARLPR